MTFTEQAHIYAGRGWRVLPLHRVGGTMNCCSCNKGLACNSAGKHPKDMEWQSKSRPSYADIQATWDDSKPPNIGLATGSESGFWVLDIDPKGGGMESMVALVDKHGRLPDTFVVQTGSGGYHYYFAMPGYELRNTQGRLGKGIDTRATGGQVVAAPSITDKGSYTIVQDVPLAQAPEWLLEGLRKDETTPQITAEDLPRPEDIPEDQWGRLNGYAKRAIDSEIARLDRLKVTGWDGEPWNATTFQVACSLLEFANSPWCAYSTGQARADVLKHAPRDTAGFDDYTVLKCFDSALAKVGQGARAMPADRTAEPDPLFGGPDVRNPGEGGGEQASPVAPGSGRQYPYREWFGGEKGTTPLYANMAGSVIDRGPVGFGIDRDWWHFDHGVWKPNEYVIDDRMVEMLGNAFRTTHVHNTKPIVRTRSYSVTGDPLEPMMNFRNGMLEWQTGDDLVDHDPAYVSTVQFPTEWAPGAECPTFEAFLGQVMHPDYVDLCWEMIGYLMLSGNPKHHAFMLYGPGGSGKSTLLRVIEELLGRDNIAAETLDDLNTNKFRAASLFGKIANIAGDIDATYQEHTATFKRLTGEDVVTAEHKNLRAFRFVNWAVPVFSANRFPGSKDVTEGYLRRWIILHFPRTIPVEERIDSLSDELALELPGIARKGVLSLRRLMERGHFAPAGEALAGKEAFALAIDQVRQWVSSGQVSAAPGAGAPLTRLYSSYTIWAENSGHRAVKQPEFSNRLNEIGYAAIETAGIIHHEGLSVPDQAPTTVGSFFGGRAASEEE